VSYAISFSLFVGVLAGGFLFPFLPWLLLRMGIWVYEIVFRWCLGVVRRSGIARGVMVWILVEIIFR